MNGIIACCIGRVGAEPEQRYTQEGQAVLAFSVAVQDAKAGAGAPAEWVRVTAWGDLAESLADTLAKGAEVYCEGRLRLNVWQAKDGQQRSGLGLSAWRCDVLGQIGRRAPRRDGQPVAAGGVRWPGEGG